MSLLSLYDRVPTSPIQTYARSPALNGNIWQWWTSCLGCLSEAVLRWIGCLPAADDLESV